MRLLLDESLPRRPRGYLPSHSVKTVVEMGWSGIKNGKLLALAAGQFDCFLTADKDLRYQQNPATLPLSVVVLDARSNELSYLLPLVPRLEQALINLRPCSFDRVG
jgi:predicted nuclease of predicted toxin-antitoxin system